VCSTEGQVLVHVNLEQMLMKHFRQTVLLGSLNMLKPDVTDLCHHNVLLSSEEGESDGFFKNYLSDFDFKK
jgi:hypothetical protein